MMKIFVVVIIISSFLVFFMYHITNLNNTQPIVIKRTKDLINGSKWNTGTQRGVTTNTSLKYILQWTNPKNVPFVYLGTGQERFIKNKCQYTNCYVTSNRYYLDDYTLFDVIIFAGPEVVAMFQSLPSVRSEHQKYVFTSIESSQYYPVCSNRFDGYFNWTWTFRLDSDSRWGYLVIRDNQNKIIGPNKVMHWMKVDDMEPASEEFKNSLKSKTRAAAWFVSNCISANNREHLVTSLQKELAKYNLTVDIYGKCGPYSCSRNNERKCEEIIQTTYYFYLAFENSFSEDYVTEKVLHGLNNNAIPIVYGAANYTRFMPEGIYLNARTLGTEYLALKMYELIRAPDQYAEYFKWKKYYSYDRRNNNKETDDYCSMCALLNNQEMLAKKSVKDNFREWWDSPKFC